MKEQCVLIYTVLYSNVVRIIQKIALTPTYGYGKYISFATQGSYVAFLGAKVFKSPCWVIRKGFLAEDEQRPKLYSAYPQIPF